MLNTNTSFKLITRDIERSLDRVERDPAVKREAEYYLKNISKVKSVKDFLADDRLFRFAMKAHGLSNMTYAKAFMKKALEEGIDSSQSFANKLADTRYRDFVETFNFARHGETATIFTRAQAGTVDRYMRQVLEENAGRDNEGVRLALYFQRKAPEIDNFYEVLADPALSRVVRTALSLPDSFASADIDKQVAFFEQKLDIADFKDAKKLDKFLERFTSLWELGNPSAGAPSSAAATLIGRPAEFGVSGSLLLQIQSMRR
ncbi:MAG TPA: DUF1217 domain-containing protein [Mesorhizobium sp.]|nr:DUF1217 domain-containing protein [Mesorhizobium sp.]